MREPLRPCPFFPFTCVSSRAEAWAHARVEPFRTPGDPGAAFARLKRIVTGMDETTVVTETDGYLHVAWRTSSGVFVDDVEFGLCAAERVIHVRSASRIGLIWDTGLNRRRIEALRLRFEDA